MEKQGKYRSGDYWIERSDLVYYQYIDYMIRCVGAKASGILDVGTGNCPYLEWWDWIPRKISIDIRAPYRSKNVEGIEANVLDHSFDEPFDVCTCLQVLEHIEDPSPFARRLFELAEIVVISVPYKWPEGRTTGHRQDPVDEEKLAGWTGRTPNYSIVVREPFQKVKSERLIAAYHSDPKTRWGRETIDQRIRPRGRIIADGDGDMGGRSTDTEAR